MSSPSADAATPPATSAGSQHAILLRFVGNWRKEMVIHTSTGEIRSLGTAIVESIFDGRFVRTIEDAELNGRPYHGIGYLGHDNFKGQYTLFWIDNLGTSASFSFGVASKDGNRLVFHGTSDDKPIRLVYTLVDHDTHTFEIFDHIGTPEESCPMRIVYTRT